jgi:hypothetical protein
VASITIEGDVLDEADAVEAIDSVHWIDPKLMRERETTFAEMASAIQ